jgi:hypothetical protein
MKFLKECKDEVVPLFFNTLPYQAPGEGSRR